MCVYIFSLYKGFFITISIKSVNDNRRQIRESLIAFHYYVRNR